VAGEVGGALEGRAEAARQALPAPPAP